MTALDPEVETVIMYLLEWARKLTAMDSELDMRTALLVLNTALSLVERNRSFRLASELAKLRGP